MLDKNNVFKVERDKSEYALRKSSIFNIDKNKPSILFVTGSSNADKYTHIYGSQQYIRDMLSEQYNIVYLTTGGDVPNSYAYDWYYKKQLYRKADNPDYIKDNYVILNDILNVDLKDCPVFDYIILGTCDIFRLTLNTYCTKSYNLSLYERQNEYFDSVTNVNLEDINSINDKLSDKYEWDRRLSPIPYSSSKPAIMYKVIKLLHDNNKLKNEVLNFIVDPAFYTPFFKYNNIPARNLYFENDKRGTRDMEKWPMAQFQHIVYTKQFQNNLNIFNKNSKVKDRNLCFAGTILQSKGDRVKLWERFLRDVKSEKCTYWIPMKKNGINKKVVTTKVANNHMDLILKYFSQELVDSIKYSKHYEGEILPLQHEEIIEKFKYGMVLRCVSYEDSLNFKPILYTYKGVLPLLDPMYDPDYLQIPKHIQDKIVVEDAAAIDERIEYFNNNEDERVEILNELYEIFMIDEFVNNEEETVKKYIQQLIPEYK